MKKPEFKKYCDNGHCYLKQHRLRMLGDGLKQECPVCGAVHDPESDMTVHERNQYEMTSVGFTTPGLKDGDVFTIDGFYDDKTKALKKIVYRQEADKK